MKNYIIFVSCLVASFVVSSKPVYLDCLLSNEKEKYHFSVSVDEEDKQISHKSETGDGFNSEGIFSANEVSYQKVDLVSGLKMIMLYQINRIDLSIKRTFTVGPADPRFDKDVPSQKSFMIGSCEIVEDNGRKI